MKKPIKIIQCSSPHTGSTLLLNLIKGYIKPHDTYHGQIEIDNHMIIKTHKINIDEWIEKYPDYDLYFVCSNRNGETKIDEKYTNYKNVLIIDYDDINETTNNTLDQVCLFIFNKLKIFLPETVLPNEDEKTSLKNIKTRIENMNNFYEKIKNEPLSYFDKLYGIHGHHRNRK